MSLRNFALAALALTLAACGMLEKPKPPAPCPRADIVDDAGKLTRFAGTGRDLTDVQFEAEIDGVSGSCVYDDDVIDVDLQLRIVASRGPADENRRADFRYFVAVARTDQTIIAREEFDSYIEFPGNQTRAGIVEELAQHIPIQPDEPGTNFVIYVGFALSPEELEFNRAQR